MKKKFLSLFIGALAFVQIINAQPPVGTPVLVGGVPVFVTGTVSIGGTSTNVTNFALTAQVAVSQNSVFTIGTQQYAILPATQPNAFNPLQNALFDNNVAVNLNGNGFNNVNFASLFTQNPQYGGDQVFGTANGNFTVVPIPFDPTTASILAAGGFIAVVTARRRRKQLGMIA